MIPRLTVACAAVAVGLGAGAALVTTGAAPATGGATVEVALTGSSCGSSRGWREPAGTVAFDVTSHASGYSSVYVVDGDGAVVSEDPSLPEGATHRIAATLGAGTYRVRCVLTDNTAHVSGPLRISGTATASTPLRPMRSLEMVGPVQGYSAWVRKRLPALLTSSRRLDADVARGDLAAARRDWLTAHLRYERLGAAYNAFGDADEAIDAAAAGLPGGTASHDWTGFLAIEHALWTGQDAATVRRLTRRLVSDVAQLKKEFPADEIDPGDLPLRTHEILENTLQFQLTGAVDYGSGTTLATAYANTIGTAELLRVLAPRLMALAPSLLPAARAGLAAVQADLRSARRSGHWTPAAQLPTTARERLDGDVGALLETLSQLPGVLAPRNGAA